MPLNRTPPPTSQVEGLNAGEQPMGSPAAMATGGLSTTLAGQNEEIARNSNVMLQSFTQSTEELHQKAISTESGEQELRDGLRDLITHKGALDFANMTGAISKSDFLAAEKRFTQARMAVLHRVKGLTHILRTSPT